MNTHSLDVELSSSQYAYCADNADVSATGDMSLEAWLKPEQKASTAGSVFVIVSKWDTASKRSYLFYIDSADDKLFFGATDDGDAVAGHYLSSKSTTTIDSGSWVHVAVTFDISEEDINFIINGSSEAGANTGAIGASIHDNASKFALSAYNLDSGVGLYFDGLIDEVRLWKDVRSEAEIQANWKTQSPAGDNLAGYWKLDNDYTDSEKSSDLTAVNSPVFSTDVPFIETAGNVMFFGGGVAVG